MLSSWHHLLGLNVYLKILIDFMSNSTLNPILNWTLFLLVINECRAEQIQYNINGLFTGCLQIVSKLSDANVQTDIFYELQIKQLMKPDDFTVFLNVREGRAWESPRAVVNGWPVLFITNEAVLSQIN